MSVIRGPLIGLTETLTRQAVIQRDQAVTDQFGGKAARDWQTVATVPCFVWWGSMRTTTRLGKLAADAERTVEEDTAALIVPAGSDIRAHDRVADILDADGNTIADGPLEVWTVAVFDTHIELNCRRVS